MSKAMGNNNNNNNNSNGSSKDDEEFLSGIGKLPEHMLIEIFIRARVCEWAKSRACGSSGLVCCSASASSKLLSPTLTLSPLLQRHGSVPFLLVFQTPRGDPWLCILLNTCLLRIQKQRRAITTCLKPEDSTSQRNKLSAFGSFGSKLSFGMWNKGKHSTA